MTMVHDETPVIELSAQARCDACGAQACMVAEKDNFELLFCDHHRRKSEPKLIDEGWELTYDYIILEKLYGDRNKIPVS